MLLSCNGIFQTTLFQGQAWAGFFLVPDLLRSSRSFSFLCTSMYLRKLQDTVKIIARRLVMKEGGC